MNGFLLDIDNLGHQQRPTRDAAPTSAREATTRILENTLS